MTPAEQWSIDRKLHRLPDTPEARAAFYSGARYVLTRIINASQNAVLVDDLAAEMLEVNYTSP